MGHIPRISLVAMIVYVGRPSTFLQLLDRNAKSLIRLFARRATSFPMQYCSKSRVQVHTTHALTKCNYRQSYQTIYRVEFNGVHNNEKLFSKEWQFNKSLELYKLSLHLMNSINSTLSNYIEWTIYKVVFCFTHKINSVRDRVFIDLQLFR